MAELSALIRSRQVSSTELTKLYLGRLKRFDPLLKCVVTLTEDLALKQAAQADAEIAAGKISRSAPRNSLGSQGPDRLSRLSHHLGRTAVQGTSPQPEGHGRRPARGGRRRARGQALPGGAGPGRRLVRRQDAEPVGPAPGIERLVGRLGGRRCRGARGLRPGERDARQHRLSLPGLRRLGPAAHVRPGQPPRLHVAGVEHGQDRSDRPIDRGLRPGPRRHPRPRRTRPDRRRSAVRLAPRGRARAAQDRLRGGASEAARAARGAEGPACARLRAGPDRAAHGLPARCHHADARHRGGRGLRRPDAEPRDRGPQSLARDLSPGPVRAGRRVPPRRAGAHAPDAGDGEGHGVGRSLRRLRPRPGHHQPHRPPERGLPAAASATSTAGPARGPSRSPAGSTANPRSWPWPTPTSKPPATTSSARRWSSSWRRTSRGVRRG